MNDTEIVMAGATVASAAVALTALIVSIVGMVRSNSASRDAQAARENATSAQWKMSEHLQAIAEAQAIAAQAAAAEGRSTVGSRSGRLSARLVDRGRSQRLVVANVGTRALTIEGIYVDQDILVGGVADDVAGASLEPGEDVALIAALTLGTRFPVSVTMRWRDDNGEQHERTQRVTLS